MKRGCSLMAMVLIAALLTACGGGGGPGTAESHDQAAKKRRNPWELQHLTLTLAGYEGPESAGLQMAESRGYFAEAGLGVRILFPSNAASAIGYVVGEVDDLGVAALPEVVLAKEEGAPIVAVGSLTPQPTAAMIWLENSKIHRIADLKGKVVAIPNLPSQEKLLESVLARAGLTFADVKVETVGYELVSNLVSGRADAIFGGSGNVEGAELEARGLDPVVTGVDSLGVPSYEEQVLIARTDRVAKEPQVIRGFMSALRRGTTAAIEDPEAVVRVLENEDETNPEATDKGMEAGVEATLPLLSRTGYMNPRRASRLVAWMHRQGMIDRGPPVSTLLTNRYVR